MAAGNFPRALAEVLAHEGGYVDHPSDPGGATNMGITHRTLADWRGIAPWWALDKAEVRALTRTEAAAIYKARYWNAVRAGELPAGVDLAVFDFAVNSGPARAVRVLQGEIGTAVDGIVGPLTLAAAARHAAERGAAALVDRICDRRLAFLRSLSTFEVFGRGWTSRVAAVRAAAKAMASKAMAAGAAAPAAPDTDTSSPEKEHHGMDILSGYRTYIVAAAMLLAGLAQMAGVELPGFDGQSSGHLIAEALAILFLRRGLKAASAAP